MFRMNAASLRATLEQETLPRFLARYLFSGTDGLAAVQKVDATIRDLPGLAGIPLLEAWISRSGGQNATATDWSPAEASV